MIVNILLPLIAITNVQGFILSLGGPATPAAPKVFDPNCKDAIDSCWNMPEANCRAPYEEWARQNCGNRCGYCIGPTTPAPPCINKLTNCETYDKAVCSNPDYTSWAGENCRYFCRLCPQSELDRLDAITTTIKPEDCVDKVDCRQYGANACGGSFKAWSEDNCKSYCGYCTGIPTAPPVCEDKIPNCKAYNRDTCTNADYHLWVLDNCKKYCGLCGGSPSPVTLAPPVPGNLVPVITYQPPTPPAPGKRDSSAKDKRQFHGSHHHGGTPMCWDSESDDPSCVSAAPSVEPTSAVAINGSNFPGGEYGHHHQPNQEWDSKPEKTTVKTKAPEKTTKAEESTTYPTTVTDEPTTTTELPTTTTELPTTTMELPTTPTELPTTTTELPTTPAEVPTTTTELLTSVTEDLATEAATTTTEIHTTVTEAGTTAPTEFDTTTTDLPTTITDSSPDQSSTTPDVITTTTEVPVTMMPGTTTTVAPSEIVTEPLTTTTEGQPPVKTSPATTTTTLPPTVTELPVTSGTPLFTDSPSAATTQAPPLTASTAAATTQAPPLTASTAAATTQAPPQTASTAAATTQGPPPTVSTAAATTQGPPPTVSTAAATTQTTQGAPETASTAAATTQGPPATVSTAAATTQGPPPTGSTAAATTQALTPSTTTTTQASMTTTTTGVDTTTVACVDTIENCALYGTKICNTTVYKPWATAHCSAFCGFCTEVTLTPFQCGNKIDNCAEFDGGDLCSAVDYFAWARENCFAYCGFPPCGSNTETFTPPPMTTTEIATTTDTGNETCVDVADNCFSLSDESCFGVYEAWAKSHCGLRCGFCGVLPCEDKTDCAAYPSDICTSDTYTIWSRENCRKFCNWCARPTPPQLTTQSTPAITVTDIPDGSAATDISSTALVATTDAGKETCVDIADNCFSFSDENCFGVYEAWARSHCGLRCGFCGVLPCEDKLDCAAFGSDVCTSDTYRIWSRQNCRKFCNGCGRPTPRPSTTQQPATTAAALDSTTNANSGSGD